MGEIAMIPTPKAYDDLLRSARVRASICAFFWLKTMTGEDTFLGWIVPKGNPFSTKVQ
jgi:trans-aconitate methyltransferase